MSPRPAFPPAVLFALALAWGCLAPTGPAFAQVGTIKHAPPIDNSIRTTTAATLTAAQQAAVDTFIRTTVGSLKDTKTKDQQRAARTDLESNAVSSVPSVPTSAAYAFAYATTLNRALLPLAEKNQPLSVRLNAAIVTANVAARMENAALAQAAIAFTNDAADPVALWGVKAGKNIFAYQLDLKQAGPYQAAIVKAVSTFRHDPALVEEAYDVFTGDRIIAGAPAGSIPGPAGAIPPTRMTAAIPAVVDLMRHRASVYKAATEQVTAGDDPDLVNPDADNRAYSFIAYPAVWRAANAAEQKMMAGAGLDLMNQAMALMTALPDRVQGDAPEALRSNDLTSLIIQGGTAYSVIGGLSANAAVAAAGTALTPAKLPINPNAPTLQPLVTALSAAATSSGFAPQPTPLPALPTTAPAAPAAPAHAPAGPAPAGRAAGPAPARPATAPAAKPRP